MRVDLVTRCPKCRGWVLVFRREGRPDWINMHIPRRKSKVCCGSGTEPKSKVWEMDELAKAVEAGEQSRE